MPTYVTMYKFTDQGIKNVKESPKRLEAGIKAFEAMGGKMLGAYYMLGEYDLVTVGEIASEEAGVAFALSIGALGNVRSTTLRAFSPREFAEIIKKMP
jgi:uncharacterized protein with GYD domain